MLLKPRLLLYILTGTVALSLIWYWFKEEPAVIQPLTQPWEKAVPHQELPEGLASMNAAYCGACHPDHYREWQYSTHSHAWTDLQFQAELKKESSPFMCINCHIPLQNQQEFIVEGLLDGDIYQPVKVANPHFDESLQAEGITCVSCHVRNHQIVGNIGSPYAPHATQVDTDFLSEKLCISCHNAAAVITPTLACSFETGDEWKAGPYHPEENCISCHMETVERPIVPGYPARKSHYHFFPGSGIPKRASAKTKGLQGMGIYPDLPRSTYALGDSLQFILRLVNESAGHRLPTGDPERFYQITFTLYDEHRTVLKQHTEKIGEEWQWYPTAKKLSDNNLNPHEARTFVFSYLPGEAQQLDLSVDVTKHRLDEESAAYNQLTEEYPLFISIFEEVYTIEVVE